MSQLTEHPAYVLIEDQLDAIGHKFRIVKLVRGTMLWLVFGGVACLAAALAADVIGAGWAAGGILGLWVLWLVVSAGAWLVRPLLIRPSPVAVARLIERRVDGLHNGLTNSVLLAQAEDLQSTPIASQWIGQIFDEVLVSCRREPLESAVRFKDLTPLGMRLCVVAAFMLVAAVLMPGRIAHGWEQMFSPTSFVPKVGRTQIVEVTPGDVTLVAGQGLDIGIVAKADGTPPVARVVLDSGTIASDLQAAAEPNDDALRYSYRIDHVDAAMKYRVEVGGTQSEWYSVHVVPKVSVTGLDIKITPPAYTRLPVRNVSMKEADLQHAAVDVPQGSALEIGVSIDVPAKGAMLQLDSQPPLEMTAALANQRFFRQTTIVNDTVAYAAIVSGDSVIARVPENGINIRCIPDGPPAISMVWPSQEMTLAPTQDLTIKATLRDDYGITSARLLVGFGQAEPTVVAGSEQRFDQSPTIQAVQFPLKLTAEQSQHETVVTVQVEATDNRDLTELNSQWGAQSARGAKRTITFQDPKQIAIAETEQSERLTAILQEMIKTQQGLIDRTAGQIPATAAAHPLDRDIFSAIGTGQSDLRQTMQKTAQTFEFNDRTRIVQKTLMVLSLNAATEAVDAAAQIVAEPLAPEQFRQVMALKSKQTSILETLQTLLARLEATDSPATQPAAVAGASLPARVEAFKKLDDALKEYEKEQQRILNQSAPLAKKPVDDYDDQDKKNLEDMRIAQDKLDAFMQETLADFSKDAEQDMSNPSLLKELMQVYSEVTMAKDALEKKSEELAVPLEENGLEQAKELESNIEKWLANAPDRTAWTQEDPLTKTDTPMPELPKELEDMVGNLLEQQEDLDQQMDDANANWADSMDKGVGWDATDGPIADMSAKGVTGNTLPNNNEMQGRSGEGRSGQSSGEFVGDSAVGKGGRNTPTRLDPTSFQAGQIKDTSKDPVGGATGGGKMSGEGASGLEGPVPPKTAQMQRLAQMQAQIRNTAEKLNLQYQLGRYDNFKLLQSIVNMRRVESDLDSNRYQNAMRQTQVVVNELNTSDILIGGRMQVEQDTTPTAGHKSQKEIEDASQGELPPVWSDALREYYKKLSEQ